MIKLFFILLLLSVKVTGQVSRSDTARTGWSAKERSDFLESCIKTAMDSLYGGKAIAYCTCMQQKLEAKYPDIRDLNKITEDTMQTPTMIAMVNSCFDNDNPGTTIANEDYDKDSIYTKVEIEAAFPGGDAAWRRYLEKNLMNFNPADNGAPDGMYTIRVQFTVDKEGKIANVTALTHYGYGMEAIAIRVIKNGPRWIPAIMDGHSVKAWRKQPISFLVSSY